MRAVVRTMTERQEILKRMKKIEDYFEQCSADNKLFRPEFECAKTIRDIVGHGSQLTRQEAEEIVKIHNGTNAGQHHSGSGWMDYQLHLRHLLTVDNLKVEIESSSGQMRINAG